MKRILIFLIVVFLIGCGHPGLKPVDWDHSKQIQPALADGSFWKPCDVLVADGQLEAAAAQRNIQIDQVISGVDSFYSDYKTKVLLNKSTLDTGVDIAQVAMSTLSSYFTSVDVIRRLALSSTILGGSKLAFDKNFLQNQGAVILIERMETLRKEKYSEIEKNKALPYDQYSLDAGMKDVTEYFDNGTIIGALLSINAGPKP